jgi:hypothetical protein
VNEFQRFKIGAFTILFGLNKLRMIQKLKIHLSNDILRYYHFILSLKESKDEWVYHFMPDVEYAKLDDLDRSKIYWKEMLYRIHIVILVSLFKSMRWLDSIENNMDNYYGFCANLRGLIESCADSYYTLSSVPLTVANDYKEIYELIRNYSPKTIITNQKLQSILLHYIQATKLTREQKKLYPDEFNSKLVIEYISCIKEGNERIHDLYNILCGMAHPSNESTNPFLFLHNGETIVCSDSGHFESTLVANLLNDFNESLTIMFRDFMENILVTQKLLNCFNLQEINMDLTMVHNLDNHPSWSEIENKMNESIKIYSNSISELKL